MVRAFMFLLVVVSTTIVPGRLVNYDRDEFLGKWIYTRNRNERIYVVKEKDVYVFKFLTKGIIRDSKPATYSQGIFTIDSIIDMTAYLEASGATLVFEGAQYRRLSEQEANTLNAQHNQERQLAAEAERQKQIAARDRRLAEERKKVLDAAALRIGKAVAIHDKATFTKEISLYPELIASEYSVGWITHASAVNAPWKVRMDYVRFVMGFGVKLDTPTAVWLDTGPYSTGTRLHQYVASLINTYKYEDALYRTDFESISSDWLEFMVMEGVDINALDTKGQTAFDYLVRRQFVPGTMPGVKKFVQKMRDLGAKESKDMLRIDSSKSDSGLVILGDEKKPFRLKDQAGKVLVFVYGDSSYGISALLRLSEAHRPRGIAVALVVGGYYDDAIAFHEKQKSKGVMILWDSRGAFKQSYLHDATEITGSYYTYLYFSRKSEFVTAFPARLARDKEEEALRLSGIWDKE